MPEKDISAQLPECYVPCDGSEITLGIWKGHRTPDLNTAKRFPRGGSVSNALKIEEDSLQEHTHYHTLTDDGHTHGFTGRYLKKSHFFLLAFYPESDVVNIRNKTGGITFVLKELSKANSGITMSVGNVRGGRKTSETKPKNMNVVFIMKVC